MSSPDRPCLRLKATCTTSVLGRAYAVSKGMSADPTLFSGANPAVSVLQAQIVKVEDAYKLATARTKGAAKTCAFERAVLVGMLRTECVYVDTLCSAMPEQASMIIESAGMFGVTARAQDQSLLRVTRGAASGTVQLDAAVRRLVGGRNRKGRFFSWQWTTDGGQTFHDVPHTPEGKTAIAGLAPFTTGGFRVKVTTTSGDGEWSPVVSILVH